MNIKFSPRDLLLDSEIEFKYKFAPVVDMQRYEVAVQTCLLSLESIKPSVFFLNLQLLDSELPQIIWYTILIQNIHQKSNTSELIALFEKENPIGYNQKSGHPYYRKKMSDFLFHLASGMKTETVWKGVCDTDIEFIVESEKSKCISFHTYDLNIFREYLINNTKFEQVFTGENENNPTHPITKNYYHGSLYEENNVYYLKLNLQIRFTQ